MSLTRWLCVAAPLRYFGPGEGETSSTSVGSTCWGWWLKPLVGWKGISMEQRIWCMILSVKTRKTFLDFKVTSMEINILAEANIEKREALLYQRQWCQHTHTHTHLVPTHLQKKNKKKHILVSLIFLYTKIHSTSQQLQSSRAELHRPPKMQKLANGELNGREAQYWKVLEPQKLYGISGAKYPWTKLVELSFHSWMIWEDSFLNSGTTNQPHTQWTILARLSLSLGWNRSFLVDFSRAIHLPESQAKKSGPKKNPHSFPLCLRWGGLPIAKGEVVLGHLAERRWLIRHKTRQVSMRVSAATSPPRCGRIPTWGSPSGPAVAPNQLAIDLWQFDLHIVSPISCCISRIPVLCVCG